MTVVLTLLHTEMLHGIPTVYTLLQQHLHQILHCTQNRIFRQTTDTAVCHCYHHRQSSSLHSLFHKIPCNIITSNTHHYIYKAIKIVMIQYVERTYQHIVGFSLVWVTIPKGKFIRSRQGALLSQLTIEATLLRQPGMPKLKWLKEFTIKAKINHSEQFQ